MRSDIIPGARFPDYELPDQAGRSQRVSAVQGNDPLVLLLARGGYCPKENAPPVGRRAEGDVLPIQERLTKKTNGGSTRRPGARRLHECVSLRRAMRSRGMAPSCTAIDTPMTAAMETW
jgi:hypothetical protein